MNKLTLGSLFDGSGGFPLGGLLCGIEPLWASEVEPFPIRVTTKRIPKMKHYGDINKINGAELPPVDIITLGSPCTDMSLAGKRAGLEGEQSVLFYEAIRIIKEMRCKTNGKYPRYAVWENVPGAFSSNKGEDFKTVLEAFINIKEPNTSVPLPEKGRWPYADIYVGDGWSIAYRTIDAQYFGVPQRRRRIYLVADFAGGCAGEILFEFQGMSRNFTKGFSPGQRTASDAENCSGETGNEINCLKYQDGKVITFEPGATSRIGGHTDENLSGTIRARMGDNQTAVVIENHPTDSRIKLSEDNKVQTLTSRMGTGGGNVPLVMNERQFALTVGEDIANTLTSTDYKGTQCVFEPTAFGICSDNKNTLLSINQNIDIAVVALQGSMIGREDKNGPQGSGIDENISFTLNTVDRHGVVYGIDRESFNCGQNYAGNLGITEDSVASTLNAQGPSAVAQPYQNISSTISAGAHPSGFNGQDALNDTLVPVSINDDPEYIVRRLTPTECARLQGFPDYWCTGLGTDNPTEEEISFWTEVWETHRKIVSKNSKSKTRKQIIKWLKNSNSDAAEYKMWGNGVALPCVCFVMAGIVLSAQNNAH